MANVLRGMVAPEYDYYVSGAEALDAALREEQDALAQVRRAVEADVYQSSYRLMENLARTEKLTNTSYSMGLAHIRAQANAGLMQDVRESAMRRAAGAQRATMLRQAAPGALGRDVLRGVGTAAAIAASAGAFAPAAGAAGAAGAATKAATATKDWWSPVIAGIGSSMAGLGGEYTEAAMRRANPELYGLEGLTDVGDDYITASTSQTARAGKRATAAGERKRSQLSGLDSEVFDPYNVLFL